MHACPGWQLGRAGFPYVIAAIILHGAGGSTYTMATGTAHTPCLQRYSSDNALITLLLLW